MAALDDFIAARPYELDDFQLEGCRVVDSDRGVLVCAPTGAGKTVVGEYAVFLALSRGTKCFYTTPIKALSNQKYHDLVAAHGEDAVGLLTGDVSINPQADVVVMTTEVLRNMIYARSGRLDRLSHVVMDEIHYLADRERGAVWEEIILGLDESVSIVGLSATVSNYEEFGQWLRTVRGDTEVVVSEFRPVPLNQYMMVGRRIHELFEPGGDRVNGRLLRDIERIETHEDRFKPLGRPEVLEVLHGQQMLPAITFIFSRAGCDGALIQCHRSRLVLTTQEEAAEIGEIVDRRVADIPDEDLRVLRFRQWRSALTRGFAAHHAGMLPAFRHIVEELFVKGLIKAVFATETLALGINMPARTVVLERLVKFNGEAHVELTPGQYTQLTGRAGRRGIDTLGNAVVQWAPAVDPRAVAGLASTRTYPLISTFSPGYNMAINLLRLNGLDESIALIEKSFAQYQADASVVGDARELERTTAKLTAAQARLADQIERLAVPGTADDVVEYVELRRDLAHREREAKRQAAEERGKEVIAILGRLQAGDVIALAAAKRPLLAVVNMAAAQASDPRPWITTEQGWSGRIDAEGITIPPIEVGRMRLSTAARRQPRRAVRSVVAEFKRQRFHRPKKMRQRTRLSSKYREAVHNHPVHSWPTADREALARTAEEVGRLQALHDRGRAKVAHAQGSLARDFEKILALLTELDYVEIVAGEPVVTEEGDRLARIYLATDLLVAQCLKRGVWDGLDPAELAGVVSLCTFENRKPTMAPEVEVPTDAMVTAMEDTERIYAELVADEQRHELPATREPEPQFATAVHQWAAGAPLGYCLAAAARNGSELTPGDFVRSCLQVNDLLQQIAQSGYSDEIRRNARRAVAAISRGVVAVSA
ncbi:DEAD/DEAH box helicase [Corynebacterium uterequi]|uniref:Superfamily II RNA helicase n=1 Tax=Corynebacterium uterequi TaxID=1072256 RepID=A0A0G3HGL0_9CORY|nr:DEAD/DEAH box helicase [Corynebacterium uterequi]AKK11078.1 superfamily II RNA helicase [Corynebacterium uterequi]